MSSMSVGARMYHQALDEVLLKIQVAQDTCQLLCQNSKSREADAMILAIQKETLCMVQASHKHILFQACELTSKEKHVLQG